LAALSGLFSSDLYNGIQRRNAVMLGGWCEQRSGERQLTTMPATIEANGRRYIGLVRDLSESGLFVYSNFEPKYGECLFLSLKVTQDDSVTHLECSGQVVRVETAVRGGATGIALKLDGVALGEKA
jgi:PilZ domain